MKVSPHEPYKLSLAAGELAKLSSLENESARLSATAAEYAAGRIVRAQREARKQLGVCPSPANQDAVLDAHTWNPHNAADRQVLRRLRGAARENVWRHYEESSRPFLVALLQRALASHKAELEVQRGREEAWQRVVSDWEPWGARYGRRPSLIGLPSEGIAEIVTATETILARIQQPPGRADDRAPDLRGPLMGARYGISDFPPAGGK